MDELNGYHFLLLRSAEAEPASFLLLGLFRSSIGSSARSCRSTCSWSASSGLFLARVVNVIPGHIEENGLHGDERLLGRQLNNVVEVDVSNRIFVQAFHERNRTKGCFLHLSFAQVVDMDNGAVTLEFAVNELGERRDGVGRHLEIQRRSCRVGAFGELRGGLTLSEGVVDESERIGDMAGDGV